MTQTNGDGTILKGNFHPAATNAMKYIKKLPIKTIALHIETFASSALAGNKLAEICGETLRRVTEDRRVSDRYLLGLAWTIKSMRED